MGRDKAWLPFGAETLLQRIIRSVAVVIPWSRIVVVSAPGQVLPGFPGAVKHVVDRTPGLGPLEGLRVGLDALAGQADPVFATSCDLPLLVPGVITLLLERLGVADAAVPWEDSADDSRGHPLTAVYRTRVRSFLAARLTQGQLRLHGLFEELSVVRVPVDELRVVDPPLHSLMNINRPEDYQRALLVAGMSSPDTTSASVAEPPRG